MGGVSWTFNVSSGCLGVLMPDTSVYIRDPDSGAKLGPGETGEIMASTLTMMKGYINRDQANKEFFAGDGYSHTGDLGYYDSEGKLYFKDRAKEIIKVSETQSALEVTRSAGRSPRAGWDRASWRTSSSRSAA